MSMKAPGKRGCPRILYRVGSMTIDKARGGMLGKLSHRLKGSRRLDVRPNVLQIKKSG